jgi:hypothetical protein
MDFAEVPSRFQNPQRNGTGLAPAVSADVFRDLCAPDQVIEIRCLNSGKGTISGYFDDFSEAATVAARLDSAGVPAVYFTLNPINSALLARAKNKIVPYAKHTTSDADILRRRWLPIDLDPVRPAGISATDAEHEAALEQAGAIDQWLRDEFGFPKGVPADSGNGAHLLYRIDLPNDDNSRALVESILKALHEKFTDDRVKVDLTTFNAARIWKCYGTTARKGDATEDRPHRVSRLISDAASAEIVGVDLLQRVADLAPKPARSSTPTAINNHHQFDLDDFIARRGIVVKRQSGWKDGRRLILEACPFNPDHNRGEAVITQSGDGAIGFRCHHNGCASYKWADLREKFEPGHKDRKEAAGVGQRIIDAIVNKPAADGHIQNNTKHETISETEDLPVSCLVENPPIEAIRPFPNSAWSGLFGQWRAMVAPCTEASLESIWAAFLLAAGTMIGPQRLAIHAARRLSEFLCATAWSNGRLTQVNRAVAYPGNAAPRGRGC